MKRTKKILSLALCAVLLVAGTVATTVAYLTSTTDVVNNTFTVGNVSITLDEADVDVYGVKNGTTRDKANQYKLIPGHKYVKDPTIHVGATSEKVVLFVKVVNGIAAIEDNTDTTLTIEEQMLAKGWERLLNESGEWITNIWYWTGDQNSDDVTEVPKVEDANANVIVFDSFTLDKNANVESCSSASITIEAYAVQADGFVDNNSSDDKNATEIWTAAPCEAWTNTSSN